ncbi:MAG: BMP family ABC transporter substrate-binding protein [Clostridia bacterium]|nr:BMP family ABC transporter substrate-binding protein [Clostridia bacterium]
MKKKLLAILLCLAILASCLAVFTACSKKQNTKTLIAVVTDIGELYDGGFNENTYKGVKEFAEANGQDYKYYQPGNTTNVTDDDREAAMRKAISEGAKVIVAPGYLQENAIKKVATDHPDVKFIFVDGEDPVGLDNVTVVSFKEEESGFIAGYSAVKEGWNKLGGTFGGGGTYAACNRFAYGYVQGAIAAATGRFDVFVKISFKYGNDFADSPELTSQIKDWYDTGTQVVFACGGAMFDSVKAAAENATPSELVTPRWIIGVDVDQSELSYRVVTSAIKRIDEAVKHVLTKYFNGQWDSELANQISKLGAHEDATGIPDDPWKFQTYQLQEYYNMYDAMKAGRFEPSPNVAEDCNNLNWWATQVAALNTLYGSSVSVEVIPFESET